MHFFKAHAYGNDFLYVKRDAVPDVPYDELTREMCDRHKGIGADGLILYERTPDGASMQLFNADGSRAEVSGNGVRALGAILLQDEARLETTLTIHTPQGPNGSSASAETEPARPFAPPWDYRAACDNFRSPWLQNDCSLL